MRSVHRRPCRNSHPELDVRISQVAHASCVHVSMDQAWASRQQSFRIVCLSFVLSFSYFFSPLSHAGHHRKENMDNWYTLTFWRLSFYSSSFHPTCGPNQGNQYKIPSYGSFLLPHLTTTTQWSDLIDVIVQAFWDPAQPSNEQKFVRRA